DGHGIDLLVHLFQHLAEIVVLFRLRELLGHPLHHVVVHVADGDDISDLPGLFGVALALAADADAGEVDLLIGCLAGRHTETAGRPEADTGESGLLQEVTTIAPRTHERTPCEESAAGLPRRRRCGAVSTWAGEDTGVIPIS